MKIKLNSYCLELLLQNNISTSTYGNRLKLGDEIVIPESGFMEEYSSFNVGNCLCQIGSFSYSNAVIPRVDIKMGRYNSIARGLNFIFAAHPLSLLSTSSSFYDPNFVIFRSASAKFLGGEFSKYRYGDFVPPPPPTILENDVYVCANAILKPGITLHTGCVVGQNALVTKDVPPFAVVGGIPAKILKYRFDKTTIERILRLEWWKYGFFDFKGIDLKRGINDYLDELESRIQNQTITPFMPKKLYFQDLIERSKAQKIYPLLSQQPQTQLQSKSKPKQTQNSLKGAPLRIQSHLAYKLGQAMILNSQSLWGMARLPYVLSYLKESHKKEQKQYQERIAKNPSLKLPPLESYADYEEALKIKNYTSYKLGEGLITANRAGGGGIIALFAQSLCG